MRARLPALMGALLAAAPHCEFVRGAKFGAPSAPAEDGNPGKCVAGDCENGSGHYIWDNGSQYNGTWLRGVRHGHGKFVAANGILVVEGEFINGQAQDKVRPDPLRLHAPAEAAETPQDATTAGLPPPATGRYRPRDPTAKLYVFATGPSGSIFDTAEADAALFKAVRGGTAAQVKELLAEWGVDPDAWDAGITDGRGTRASHLLHEAARRKVGKVGDDILQICRELIRAGATLDAGDRSDNTALHVSVQHNHLDIARILVEAGAAVNAQNKWGVTPLHYAASHGVHNAAQPAVQYLLEAGADPSLEAHDGKTPLAVAEAHKLHMVAALLRRTIAGRPEVKAEL